MTCRWFYCRLQMLTGAQCTCHWHLVWKILRGWTRQRTTLLGVLNTPAARRSRTAPTTEDRVAGKRPFVVDPSPAEALPAESSQAPKRRQLVRIADDDDEEEEAAPSLVRRSCSRLNIAAITGDRATSDPLPLTPSRRVLGR